MSGDGFADESMIERSVTSPTIFWRLFGAGEPTAGVMLVGMTSKPILRTPLSLGCFESRSISTPQVPASANLTLSTM